MTSDSTAEVPVISRPPRNFAPRIALQIGIANLKADNEIFYPKIAPYSSAVQSFTREEALHFTLSDPAVLHAVLGQIVRSDNTSVLLSTSPWI
jgi:hypothetical protein